MMILRFALVAALLAHSATLRAQTGGPAPSDTTTELFLGVSPAEVTVGDRFQAIVRVDAPDDVSVEYPDIAGGDTIQSLSPVRITTTAAGDTVAVYTLVAWIAGQPLSATVPVRLRSAAGVTELPVSLRLPRVVSVLPASDTIVEPRPAKPLIVPPLLGESSWFWIYLLIAALLAGALGYWLLDRRRREVDDPGDPREWALAQLALLEQTPMSSAEEREARYHRISRILRLYVARVDPDHGLDLTTTELSAALHERLPDEIPGALTRLLDAADKVKFAGARPSQIDADLLLDDARAFVAIYPAPVQPESDSRRAA
jgi:hypothetical protein